MISVNALNLFNSSILTYASLLLVLGKETLWMLYLECRKVATPRNSFSSDDVLGFFLSSDSKKRMKFFKFTVISIIPPHVESVIEIDLAAFLFQVSEPTIYLHTKKNLVSHFHINTDLSLLESIDYNRY